MNGFINLTNTAGREISVNIIWIKSYEDSPNDIANASLMVGEVNLLVRDTKDEIAAKIGADANKKDLGDL